MKPAVMGPIALLPLVLGAVSALGQSPVGELQGSVISSTNGRPVPRATVFVHNLRRRNQSRSVTADSQGHFIVSKLEAGAYQLRADLAGYFSDAHRRSFQPVIQLSEGEQRKDILVRLLPAGVVTGQLVNEFNDPLVRVSVTLLKRTVYRGRASMATVGLALTDDRGEYRIYGIEPGRYFLLAQVSPALQSKALEIITGAGVMGVIDRSALPAYSPTEAPPEPETVYPPVFFPNTTDFQQASELPVGPGDEVHANLVFSSKPAVTIRGVVLNGLTGHRAKSASVSAYWTDVFGSSGGNIPGKSNQEGEFEIRGVAPGIYTLRAAFSDDSVGFYDEQIVEVGAHGRDAVTMAGLPEARLEGQVVLESSDPKYARLTMPSVSVTFSPVQTQGNARAVARYPDFKLETRLRPLEHYTVSAANLPDDFYLKSVRIGGHDVEQNNISVAFRDHIDLVLSPAGGHVDGTVFDQGDQLAAAYVMLLPDTPRGAQEPGFFDQVRSTRSDSKGKFVLRGIPPGTYKVFAFEGFTPDELLNDAATLNDYSERGETLMVSEGSKLATVLKAIAIE